MTLPLAGAVVVILALAAPVVISVLGLPGPQAHDGAALILFGDPTGPSGPHPLGVDAAGRDVLSRILDGLRSLVLLAGSGTALAVITGAAITALAVRIRGLARAWTLLCRALGTFPALLLGLALSVRLGRGAGGMILVVAITQVGVGLAPASTAAAGRAFLRRLPGALSLVFTLTFLGVRAGGRTPELGAMVATAGRGILAGVPAWWALVFPGLAMLLASALALAARARWAGADRPSGTPVGLIGDRWALRGLDLATRAGVTLLLAFVLLPQLGGSEPGGDGPLAGAGRELAATASLTVGALLVAALTVECAIRILAGEGGWRRRLPLPPAARLGGLVLAAPLGWAAYLALALLSDSVGPIPIAPAPGSYATLAAGLGAWAQPLILAWVLLGLGLGAVAAPGLARASAEVAASAQQTVARAAGVGTGALIRQRRRSLRTGLLARLRSRLGAGIGAIVVIEVTFSIPGLGHAAAADAHAGRAAGISDIALLAAGALLLLEVALTAIVVGRDPLGPARDPLGPGRDDGRVQADGGRPENDHGPARGGDGLAHGDSQVEAP
ncbi:hypothetical protein [Conexibacter sp. DBS9H8]|uniref:hypothetical protein n=1 Tax=Conexibacter sp. DBS9H8 TaxID=2937801 RepID=UPI00201043F5|nr:hypothetical protein [Conexibacter sp. DBS9H8]